jgi:hypothetical protein
MKYIYLITALALKINLISERAVAKEKCGKSKSFPNMEA